MGIEHHLLHFAGPGEGSPVTRSCTPIEAESGSPNSHSGTSKCAVCMVWGSRLTANKRKSLLILGGLAVIEDVIVPGVVEPQIGKLLQRRVRLPQPVDEGDIRLDVALAVPIPRLDLVFLGIEIFLLAGECPRLAELEAAVKAVVAGKRRREHEADLKAGPAARLQIGRVDVGRVDEEVRPKVLRHVAGGELGEIVRQLLLRIAPGEIGVGLREPQFGEQLHRLWPGEGLGEEDHLRVRLVHLADQPLPERERLGVGIVDAEDLHALVDPVEDDVAERHPDRGEGVAIEMDVDDVLVFLRRILREFDGAVGAPVEPLRMFLDPGVIARALDGEVESDVETLQSRLLDEALEARKRAKLRVDRVMSALRGADGIRTARIVGRGLERIISPLRAVRPTGWIGGK